MIPFVFLGSILIFIILQYLCNPFLIKENNLFEMILLICLMFIISTEFTSAIDHISINIIISTLIIIPFPILILFIIILYINAEPNGNKHQNMKPVPTRSTEDVLDDDNDDEKDDNVHDEFGTVVNQLQRQSTWNIQHDEIHRYDTVETNVIAGTHNTNIEMHIQIVDSDNEEFIEIPRNKSVKL